ncbi:restriction endonuclease subunit S [Enterococcus hirae]|uniref:restriction endonuclease subunit S n=1 Tax=Enterococcus hirae TaxID=1354 RepID=UPI0021E8C4A7|nr:restriction endonuclease subunit S [Enterococcus hirae]MCV3097376.1 restriction endonuclease subunit S [Enterococcus hirae]MCV3124975.1 restriction endonuclease subunit S [Enterococcus hirae]
MSNDTQPEIRFPGFTEDWEQRKLGDITESFSGGTPTAGKSEYYGGDIPFIRSGEISSELTELFITENGLNNSSAKMVKAGDILYALYGATSGEVSISRINGAINQAILAIRPTKNDNSYLIVQWLRKQKDTIISTYLQGGQGNLSGSIVKDLVITLPQDKEEQNKIGAFFKQLDDTIALHQRKLDLLKETKKGFLQKMFPKNGAKVPEIRFPGFTDDWEQRTLGDILKEFSIKSKVENEYTVLSSTNSGMEIRNGRVSGVSNLGYKIIENGDLVLSPQNLWLGNININNVGTGLVSPSYKTFKFIKVDPGFIRPQLRTARMLEEYKNSSTQGASVVRRNLELGSFYQITIKIPSDVEQGKIGLFFKQLDNLIALHQRKLDLLKETKKGFLQKMFV